MHCWVPLGCIEEPRKPEDFSFFLFFLCGAFNSSTLSQAMALIPEIKKLKSKDVLVDKYLGAENAVCLWAQQQ